MFRILKQAIKTGIKTEALAPAEHTVEIIGEQLEAAIRQHFHGSLAIRIVDAGSCNGCELEVHASNNCYYDLERFGVHFVPSPRFADLLLVTGPVSVNMATALRMTYEAMPQPALVLAMGDCAVNCGVFGQANYAIAGTVADIIPVNATLKGCPPSPTDLIQALLQLCHVDA